MKNSQILSSEALWHAIYQEAEQSAQDEPMLASFLHLSVLRNHNLQQVLAFNLSGKLSCAAMDARALYEIFLQVLYSCDSLILAAEADIQAHYLRDPACDAYCSPLLYFKGFQAVQTHRINHCLWNSSRKALAYFLQNRVSEVFGVDIHPAAHFGQGIMVDHGTGLVVGETAVLGNNISILHGVTLGGSGKETGDRHPKVGDGVMIGAHASVLGNIHIGNGARIGAGSVVVADVPEGCTVVGVPARVVGSAGHAPAEEMNQSL